MKSVRQKLWLLAAASVPTIWASAALADPLACNLTGYKPADGLAAAMDGDNLVVTWAGDPGQEGRLRFSVNGGTPMVQDLSLRAGAGAWVSLVSNATPDISVMTGIRRMSTQQLEPLYALKVPITQEILDRYRWDPFWDAPFDVRPNPTDNRQPPKAGLPGTDQKGLPRDPTEVQRANAVYAVQGCDVKTNGGRIEVSFPGVTLGVFSGKLVYSVFKGSNLVKQEVSATTQNKWVAYKYDSGLKGIAIKPDTKAAYRDIANTWQTYDFTGAVNVDKTQLAAANRIVVAQPSAAGAIAAFPPPHKFFWARESAIIMNYNWYRKDADGTFGFGVRQNEHEDYSEGQENWALYSARPGTEQLMPVFLYPSLGSITQAHAGAMAFTHNDTYKAIPGYQAMNHHYHMNIPQRWKAEGVDYKLPDLQAMKAMGLKIVSPIWNFTMFGFDGADPATVDQTSMAAAQKALPRGGDYIALQALAVLGAKIHSDKDFLVMPDQEIYSGPLGGHTDLLFSHQVLWDQKRPGQPFTETDAKLGKVYHVGSAQELIDMAKAEDIMISMPHPRTKGSTGYPDAVKDSSYFNDPHYVGFGLRGGMSTDGSERRVCEYRCLPLLDDISNWLADKPGPLKYINSISEVQEQKPGDDIYGSAPVTYVKLDTVPDNPAPVVAALMKGDSFVTTGEVLMTSYQVVANGKTSKVIADLDWTFPLDMVEIVWGDGKTTGRQVIATTELAPMGSHHFEIPFDATGKKWIRFAAWDTGYNGVMSQPSRLPASPRPRR